MSHRPFVRLEKVAVAFERDYLYLEVKRERERNNFRPFAFGGTFVNFCKFSIFQLLFNFEINFVEL